MIGSLEWVAYRRWFIEFERQLSRKRTLVKPQSEAIYGHKRKLRGLAAASDKLAGFNHYRKIEAFGHSVIIGLNCTKCISDLPRLF